MELRTEELALFWTTLFLYVIGFCLQLVAFATGKEKAGKWGFALLWVGMLMHTATGIVRWVAADHAPVTGTYELNLTGTWFAMLLFLGFERARRVPRAVGLTVVPIAFLVLGHGILQRTEVEPMGPAFQSPWLIVHVIFAWLAFGSYAVAMGAAMLLLKRKRTPEDPVTGQLPSLEALDLLSYRFIVLGFLNHAVMLISGAMWAKKLWGRYWSWDALETWSLLSFLLYAFYLHARAFLGWKLGRAAWLAGLGLVILSISFWGVQLFGPSMHPGP